MVFAPTGRLRNALVRRLLPSPVHARHAEYSMVYSEDDAPSAADPRLLDIALRAADGARRVDLSSLAARLGGRFSYPDATVNLWPGEHYRLLASLVSALGARRVIE